MTPITQTYGTLTTHGGYSVQQAGSWAFQITSGATGYTYSTGSAASTALTTQAVYHRGAFTTAGTKDYTVPLKAIKIAVGQPITIELPDGSKLIVAEDGSFRVDDKDAKVTYRANRVREFNRFMNASDLLEHFILDVGNLGVTQRELLTLPVELFINWLVVRAAEADGDEAPDGLRLKPAPKRCGACGRFIRRVSRIEACSLAHAERLLAA